MSSIAENAYNAQNPRVLETEAVESLVERFVDAAERAQKAGFDGVELHGSHGYLIQEFMSPRNNHRDDRYGGNFEARMRFPTEIVEGVRNAIDDAFALSFRLSAEEFVDGGLTDVLETHWSVRTNAKLHNFWAFRAFIDRLACTAEEFGITVEVRTEAWTSQTCPNCGSTEDTTRHQDTLTCTCGFEGHADLAASETFLRRHQNSESSDWRTRHNVSRQRHEEVARPMARPMCLK